MRCDINTPRAAIILILRVYFSGDWSRHDKHVKVNSKSLPFSDLPSCSFQWHAYFELQKTTNAGGGGSNFPYILLRTFALIVSAHPYCARNSLRDVMPRHAFSARAVEEMWRYIALVGILIFMNGFNSLKCSVTPYFLLIDHFLCRWSTFCEKLKKICVAEVWFFSTFLPSQHRILLLL